MYLQTKRTTASAAGSLLVCTTKVTLFLCLLTGDCSMTRPARDLLGEADDVCTRAGSNNDNTLWLWGAKQSGGDPSPSLGAPPLCPPVCGGGKADAPAPPALTRLAPSLNVLSLFCFAFFVC